jgi:hypothetical protein
MASSDTLVHGTARTESRTFYLGNESGLKSTRSSHVRKQFDGWGRREEVQTAVQSVSMRALLSAQEQWLSFNELLKVDAYRYSGWYFKARERAVCTTNSGKSSLVTPGIRTHICLRDLDLSQWMPKNKGNSLEKSPVRRKTARSSSTRPCRLKAQANRREATLRL